MKPLQIPITSGVLLGLLKEDESAPWTGSVVTVILEVRNKDHLARIDLGNDDGHVIDAIAQVYRDDRGDEVVGHVEANSFEILAEVFGERDQPSKSLDETAQDAESLTTA